MSSSWLVASPVASYWLALAYWAIPFTMLCLWVYGQKDLFRLFGTLSWIVILWGALFCSFLSLQGVHHWSDYQSFHPLESHLHVIIDCLQAIIAWVAEFFMVATGVPFIKRIRHALDG